MGRTATIVMLLMIGLVFSCGKKKTEQELLNEIQQLEAKEDFAKVAATLEQYIKQYPKSEHAPEMLNKLAMIYASGEKNFPKAIETYRELIEKYPDSKYVIQAQFMIGYIYANDIKDLDMARVEYEKFLKQYPNHELVPSVKWELENLGKDLSEIDIFAKSGGDSNNSNKGSAKK